MVTGGGVDSNGQWAACKDKYLVPVRALSKMIRGKFAKVLRKNHPDIYNSIDPATWTIDWVVHSLHYKKGHQAVLKYLARYVFRIAITNHRIISMDETHVTFRYKDRRAGKWRTCRVEGCEFIRRFLQHALPRGFHKIRYYGIWHTSSNYYTGKLVKQLLVTDTSMGNEMCREYSDDNPEDQQLASDKKIKCPYCKSDKLRLLRKLPRPRSRSPSPETFT
jgi:hypothetical protein